MIVTFGIPFFWMSVVGISLVDRKMRYSERVMAPILTLNRAFL